MNHQTPRHGTPKFDTKFGARCRVADEQKLDQTARDQGKLIRPYDTVQATVSATNSPYIDKKLNRPLLQVVNGSMSCGNTPQIKVKSRNPIQQQPSSSQTALLSPTRSEHQYDIPFSHLKPTNDYDMVMAGNPNMWGGSTLLQPRLIDGNTGAIKVNGNRGWSGSDKSLDTSIYSENSQPSMFNDYRNSLTSCTLDPDSFTFATVTHAGKSISLGDLGITLSIPEGALDKGYTEEVFLAVMTEGRDRPRLSENQTLLSPVVLVGPPRLSFKKPVVLSFGHCAHLGENDWEMGLYHCDSLFSDQDDTPWVKLATLGGSAQPNAPDHEPVLANLENESCQIMTDFLSRFCIVGQSSTELQGCDVSDVSPGAAKFVRVLVFGKNNNGMVTSSGSSGSHSQDQFCINVQVTDDIKASVDQLIRQAARQNLTLLAESPKPVKVVDEVGTNLTLSISECSTGWSLRSSRSSSIPFEHVWGSSVNNGSINFNLQHVDPTVRAFNVKISAAQTEYTENKVCFTVHVDPGLSGTALHATVTSLGSNASSNSPMERSRRNRSRQGAHSSPQHKAFSNSTRMSSSSGGSSSGSGSRSAFKLPNNLKLRLCKALDSPQSKGLNDWRALAAGLRLERFTSYFANKPSPTECILNLWEVQQQVAVNPVNDLLSLLRAIGRQDVATMIEQDVGPWVWQTPLPNNLFSDHGVKWALLETFLSFLCFKFVLKCRKNYY